MPRRLILALSLCLAAFPCRAIMGGEAAPDLAGRVVMVVSDRGSFCSATVLAPSLLITAGHCVRNGAAYRLLTYRDGAPVLSSFKRIVLHPRFDATAYEKRKFVIDLALLVPEAPLPAGHVPVSLPTSPEEGVMGARYRVAGYGLARLGEAKTGGTLRDATLTGVPLQSEIQLRLADPDGGPVGACQGDSGGPAFRVTDATGTPNPPIFVGVISSARAREERGCGGFTGVALTGTALAWIRETAAKLGIALH
jgi:hypothetical protein